MKWYFSSLIGEGFALMSCRYGVGGDEVVLYLLYFREKNGVQSLDRSEPLYFINGR